MNMIQNPGLRLARGKEPRFSTPAGDKEPFYQFYYIDDILDRPEEFEKLAIRQVLGALLDSCLRSS